MKALLNELLTLQWIVSVEYPRVEKYSRKGFDFVHESVAEESKMPLVHLHKQLGLVIQHGVVHTII